MKLSGNVRNMKRVKSKEFGTYICQLGHIWAQNMMFLRYLQFGSSDLVSGNDSYMSAVIVLKYFQNLSTSRPFLA